MFRVSLFPYSRSSYVSLIYAGLFELRAQGLVEICWRSIDSLGVDIKDLPSTTAALQVEDLNTGVSRNVGFDFLDGGAIQSSALLDHVDTYFKRSYRPSWYSSMPEQQQQKIRPFGLHFACVSAHQKQSDGLRLILLSSRAEGKRDGLGSRDKLAASPIGGLLKFATCSKNNHWHGRLPKVDQLQGALSADVNQCIYYRTRVYEPKQKNPSLGAHENETRVQIIRALKKEFGPRFFGGLRATAYAQKHYPDCLFPHELDWHGHLKAVQESMVCVTSAGLFDSTDWKLPEYLAAARCTVSEQIKFELPENLENEKQAMLFSSAEECVSHCDKVLTDPQLAQSLSHNASDYYSNHVAPHATMRRCLTSATSVAVTTE